MIGIRRRTAALTAAALAGAALLAGCGSGQGGSGTQSDSGRAGPAVADKAGPAAGQPAAGAGQQGGAAPADLRVDQRAIIYTGSITVRVDQVDRAAADLTSIVTGAGGFVGGDKRASDSSASEATLELRVPAEKFAAVTDRIAGLGRPERRDISTRDATEETVDLDARIATQRARVDSGRRLLGQAKSLGDLVMLEGEVAKREADLASLEAKKRRLADLTALSTITVTLLGPDAAAPAGPGSDSGFLAGLRGGWHAFLATLGVLLTVLGALLPWAVALGVPAYFGFRLVRRFGRRRRPGTVPAVATAPTAPGTSTD
jgi:hypothetical protein